MRPLKKLTVKINYWKFCKGNYSFQWVEHNNASVKNINERKYRSYSKSLEANVIEGKTTPLLRLPSTFSKFDIAAWKTQENTMANFSG